MIQLALNQQDYLSVCKFHRHVYDTPCIQQDMQKWKNVLTSVIAYAILAPYDNEQSDLVHRIQQDPKISDIDDFQYELCV